MPIMDPNQMAAKLMVDFARWLVRSTTTASAWKWVTSAGAGVSVSTPFKLVGAGGTGGAIQLHRPAEGDDVTLAYTMAGVGVGIAPPTQVVTVTGSTPDFPSDGRLRLFRGQHDFHTPEDFMTPGLGVLGPCAALTVEGTAILGGWSGGIMLLGIDEELISIFHQMQRHTQELSAAIRHRAPPGFWNAARDAVTRPVTILKDEALLAMDQARMMMRLETGPKFKAALFFHGAEIAASELFVTFSASITAYVGGIHAMR
jgi:hypothetical protein